MNPPAHSPNKIFFLFRPPMVITTALALLGIILQAGTPSALRLLKSQKGASLPQLSQTVFDFSTLLSDNPLLIPLGLAVCFGLSWLFFEKIRTPKQPLLEALLVIGVTALLFLAGLVLIIIAVFLPLVGTIRKMTQAA